MFFLNIIFTILLLIALTSAAFAIDFFCSFLQKRINPRYLNFTIVFILLLLMISGSYVFSVMGSWSLIDTVFVSSLCFFGLGWVTNITNKASINSQGTVAKFVTNNAYKHQYETASTAGMSLYFISSLIFLIGSWTISFLIAFM
jgi:predicted PurR-regulated permease PerM